MLTKRIIPCLDVKDNRVVKGVNFLNLRDAGNPVELGARYSDTGADELVFLDITATIRSRKTIVELVEKVAENVFIPFTVGGGIRTVEQVDELLRSGAEKVSVNTAAVENPKLLTEAARRFGNQCIVIAIDARREKRDSSPTSGTVPVFPKWLVCVKAGTEPTDIDVVEWAVEAEKLGAGYKAIKSSIPITMDTCVVTLEFIALAPVSSTTFGIVLNAGGYPTSPTTVVLDAITSEDCYGSLYGANIETVPEPATIAVLSFGSLLFLHPRK